MKFDRASLRNGIVVLSVFACQLASGATDPAVVWLGSKLDADGRVTAAADVASPLQSTAEALSALHEANLSSHPLVPAARAYLDAQTETDTETLARRVIERQRAGILPGTLVTDLSSTQNADGGFGSAPGHESTVLDTAFALEALATANLSTSTSAVRAATWLISKQAADGSFALTGNDPQVYLTALATQSLLPFRGSVTGAKDAASKARVWLLARRDVTGLWASDWESAQVLLALLPIRLAEGELAASVSALAARRGIDGSWAGDVYATALALRAQVRAAQPFSNPDLATLTGRLVDAASAAPIVGATVTIDARTTSSDASGGFRIAGLTPAKVTVVISAAGYPTLTTEPTLSAGRTADLGEIQLLQAASPTTGRIQGLVTDAATGQPAAGVQVTLSTSAHTATTAADGRYLIDGVPPGITVLTAAGSGYYSSSATANIAAGGAVLFSPALRSFPREEFSIAGLITDAANGQPLAGVTVAVSGSANLSATTGADGRVTISNVTAGTVTIALSKAGYRGKQLVATAGGAVTVDISTGLQASNGESLFDLSGRVTDKASGAPIEGASIVVAGAANANALSGADGRYQLSNLAAGNIAIAVAKAGFKVAQLNLIADPDLSIDYSPSLVAEGVSETAVKGSVVDSLTNLPIAGATVSVAGSSTVSGTSGADGNFLVAGTASGEVKVTVSADGYDPAELQLVLLEDLTSSIGAVALRPAGYRPPASIVGTLVDSSDDAPLAQLVLTVLVEGEPASVTTDAQGAFRLDAREGDAVVLVIQKPGYIASTLDILVPPGDTDLGNIRVRPEGFDVLRADLAAGSLTRVNVTSDPLSFVTQGEIEVRVYNRTVQPAGQGIDLLAFHDLDRDGVYDAGTDTELGRHTMGEDVVDLQGRTFRIPVQGSSPFRDAAILVMIDPDQHVLEVREDNNVALEIDACTVDPIPSGGPVEGKLKWRWRGTSPIGQPDEDPYEGVSMTPILAQLTDDDGDGMITGDDVPDVVFIELENRRLIAVSGIDGATLWHTKNGSPSDVGNLAAGDIDGDGIAEIIAVNSNRTRLLAYEHNGSLKWSVPTLPSTFVDPRDGVALADLDADGTVEIVHGRRVYSNTGVLKWAGNRDHGGDTSYGIMSIPADVNHDGKLEIVSGRTLYSHTGAVLWHQTLIADDDGYVGIGQLDADAFPEIVIVHNQKVSVLNHDGTVKWRNVLVPGANPSAPGGTPMVGDVDGDGIDEIGVASSSRYTVYESDGSIKWSKTIFDPSGKTGSVLFDFSYDGHPEIVYQDEETLWFFDAATGAVVRQYDNMGTPTTLEYPIIADIDGDDHAELIVPNTDRGPSGINVYEGAQGEWAPARKVWNQHSYHVTNVNDDGTIPTVPEKSWQKGYGFHVSPTFDPPPRYTPNLSAGGVQVVDNGPGQPVTLKARVGNAGNHRSPQGVVVAFYDGDPTAGGLLLGTTTLPFMAPGEYRDLSLNVATLSGDGQLFVVADSTNKLLECDELNNTASTSLRPVRGLLGLATDAPAYLPDTLATVSASVTNTGVFTQPFTVDLRIEDLAGETVVDFAPQTVAALAPNASVTVSEAWNTGLTLAGSYVVRGVLTGQDGSELALASAAFTVSAGAGGGPLAALRAGVDRLAYHTSDRVQLELLAQNLATNTVLPGASVGFVVTGPGGVVATGAVAAGDLGPGALRTLSAAVVLEDVPEGDYAVAATLTDGAGTVHATANTGFLVAADDRLTITGEVAVQSASVAQGEPQLCTETVRNTGTRAITDLRLRKLVVRLEPEAEVLRLESTLDLAAGAQVADLRSVATGGLALGDHACVLQAELEGAWQTLGFAAFTVTAPPIDVEPSLSLGSRGRVLVLLDGPTDAPTPDPYGPVPAPTLDLQRDHIEAVLTEAGWTYTIVTTAQAFETAFDTDGYEVVVILSEREKLSEALQDRLVAAVHDEGLGLVVAGNHDRRNGRLEEALGVKSTGKSLDASALLLMNSPLHAGGVADFLTVAPPNTLVPEGASLAGEYEVAPAKPGALPTGAPAVTRHTHGAGRTVYASFDLALQGATAGDDSLFAELLVGALEWVHPTPLVPRAGRVVPVELALENQGQAVTGEVHVILPTGSLAVLHPGATAQADGSLVYAFSLAEGETEIRVLHLRLPASAGFTTLTATVRVMQGGELVEHATTDLTIQVQP